MEESMRTSLMPVLLLLPSLTLAGANETNDPKILHAIGVMIQLKLKPENVTKVLSGTWQRTGQPLSCVYYVKGKTKKAAIAAIGQVKVVAADGYEQATLCYPALDMTAPVKYFAPSYLD
jgi:hypothetical protein